MRIITRILSITIIVLILTNCGSSLVHVDTRYDYKKENVSHNRNNYDLKVRYNNSSGLIKVDLTNKAEVKKYKREVKIYKKNISVWEDNPLKAGGLTLLFLAMEPFTKDHGLGVGIATLTAIVAALPIVETKKEQKKYGNWEYEGTNSSSNQPVSDAIINFSIKSSNFNTGLINLSRTKYTNSNGSCQNTISYNSDLLVSPTSKNWSKYKNSNSNKQYFKILVENSESNLSKTIDVGPFIDIRESVFQSIISKVRLNILDVNSRFPLDNTRVKCLFPNEQILRNQINKNIKTNSTLVNYCISRLQSMWSSVYTTDNNGIVDIPLIKGLKYNFEFSNRNYYFHENTIDTNKDYVEYDILLSDIGSKIRQEKVIPKTKMIKKY